MDWIQQLKSALEKEHEPSEDPQSRPSAVLLCLGNRDGQWEIVLTKRTQTVQTHKGQVSLPGGVKEEQDTSLLHTALRETEEEMGVASGDLEILGALPAVDTIGRVRIYPWVGILSLPYSFRLSSDEVEKVLFLPIQDLLSHGLKPVKVRIDGYDVQSEGIYCDNELIWGATAKILKDFRAKALEMIASLGGA